MRYNRLVVGILIFGLMGCAVVAAPADSDYVAYAVTKKGELPLPETLDSVEAEELIQVKWGGYSGPRTRAAVLEVDNASNVSTFQVSGPNGETYDYSATDLNTQVPVNGIEAMLADVLNQTGRFRLVERQVLDEALYEQDLSAEGRVSQPSGAKTGNVLGAQYLVQAVVTSYEPEFKKKKGGLGGLTKSMFGGAKVGKSKSMVGMNFRLIDAETSEVVFTKQVEVITGQTEFGLGGVGWGGSGAAGACFSSFSKTPVGQAVLAAINIGAFELTKQIGSAPVEGSVVKVGEAQVFVNLGEDAVEVGEELLAMAKGEELIDPETGLSLGGESEELGTLRIIDVKEKFSLAQPVDLELSRLNRGDKLVSTRPTEPLRFASTWEGKTK
jgi:curli biogenesis system outer membrane secretion channel CsgG